MNNWDHAPEYQIKEEMERRVRNYLSKEFRKEMTYCPYCRDWTPLGHEKCIAQSKSLAASLIQSTLRNVQSRKAG